MRLNFSLNIHKTHDGAITVVAVAFAVDVVVVVHAVVMTSMKRMNERKTENGRSREKEEEKSWASGQHTTKTTFRFLVI